MPFHSLIIFLLGIFINAMLIGMSATILLLLFGHRAEVAAWTLTAIIMLICGLYYPVTILPPGVQVVSYAIPVTHFLEYFRSFYGFTPTFAFPHVMGHLLNGVYAFIATVVHAIVIKRARRTGSVLQLSE